MTAKGRAIPTLHQSCDREPEGQQGHIIGPGRDSHLTVDQFIQIRVSNNACKFNIIILWPGKTNKAVFLFI